MGKDDIKVLLIFAVLQVLFPFSNGLDYYTAAVFEIKQTNEPWYTEAEIIQKNLEKYALAAEIASSHKADIMIFPEQGMFPRINEDKTWSLRYAEDIPDPRTESFNPCNQPDDFQNSPILRNLSCLAKTNNFYLVADLHDVKLCEINYRCYRYNKYYCRVDPRECPVDGKFIFNTLVVFDRHGNLLLKYHKRHLNLEKGITHPKDFNNVYFQTPFGKFTVDVCFDLLFGEVVEGAQGPDVTGLAFPTWWFDHTPFFLFATPFQQAWSMTNKINVLAANVHYPNHGSIGSGIYSAVKGALVSTHNPDGQSKVLISKVPTSAESIPEDMPSFDPRFYYLFEDGLVSELIGEEPRNFEFDCGDNSLSNASMEFTDYRCHQTEVTHYTFVKLVGTEGNINICSNGFCCSLNYSAESMNETFYFGVSGNPLNFLDAYLFGIQSCFLARCEPVNGEDCRNFILKSTTIFRSVEIVGSFATKYIYPYAIDSDVRLTEKEEWYFDRQSRMVYKNLRGNPLLFLCLHGRLYHQDQKIEDQIQE